MAARGQSRRSLMLGLTVERCVWRRLTEGGRTTAQSWTASLVLAADVAEFCAPVAARQISDVSLSRSRQLPAIDMVTGEIWVSRSPRPHRSPSITRRPKKCAAKIDVEHRRQRSRGFVITRPKLTCYVSIEIAARCWDDKKTDDI